METIFMIHGMWGGPWYWENYKDFFEQEGYRCVTTTLRFHNMDPKDLLLLDWEQPACWIMPKIWSKRFSSLA